MDFQKFLQGKAFDAYEYFGAHLTEEGAVFRVHRMRLMWKYREIFPAGCCCP